MQSVSSLLFIEVMDIHKCQGCFEKESKKGSLKLMGLRSRVYSLDMTNLGL